MRHHAILLAAFLQSIALSGCARRPIQDGQQIGPLIQIKDVFTSCFLLEYDPGRFALFDACSQRSGNGIRRWLDQLGYGTNAVRHVFLTHGHPEQLGGLSTLGRATVYATAAEKERIQDEGGWTDHKLADGSEVTLGAISVRTFKVPGHTAGSAVYSVDGVLVMGDTVVARRDGTLESPPDRHTEDPEENRRNVKDLARRLEAGDVEIDWIAPSRSGPVHGLEALLSFE